MLEVLGLEAEDERVYRALLGRPNSTATLLSDLLAIPQDHVGKALSHLVGWGLVISSADEQFTAAPPAMALGALISQRQDGLRLAEQALATFAEEHREAMTGNSINDLIEVVTGVDAIRHRFLQVQQAARTQIRTFITAPFVAVPPGENTAEPVAIRRGVHFRAVLDRAVLAEPGIIADAIDSLRKGVQLRVADKLPMKLALADADLGLVPLAVTPAGDPGAVLLHRSGLLDALDALFETVWSTAHPLELPRSGGEAESPVERAAECPTDLDRKILALLLAGLTDPTAAAQLGLSPRTLHRRLRHLMDMAGVRTRMQLGGHAIRHGWVEPR
ncbi:transcriptional regulator TrmB [Streptomyces cocklensis]|jgi:DNA-binding CsgD family transcriptional regulator|uniref:Sugar-specific transcriptional regulator TrmB n=1 Tax=Actinacidiphila cocklensis TaxID=887465 RepID=A0A9W4GMQ1_9ACTN|nr:helix-turn-helix domain-containing protein [Actinacidiphila cocklensis]MDD1058407.1 transcriptional regulator TrmB [Actinacidiphila cocklensis]WSX75382.1 transcriptional regulator TrmB [Streptomyces sp. NBC_00899]CAG6390553.1 Sugar-specific transcriptional regulator TrmB [Actinacidiphila cocklensis]